MHRNGQHRNGSPERVLNAYLLGVVEFEAALQLQRRLHYEVSGDRDHGCLILCEHPPMITVGRQGSRAHILCEPEELRSREWRVRWVNRGGGTWLHMPGQLVVYPIVPLDELGLNINGYLERLSHVVQAVLDDFSIRGEKRAGKGGVWVQSRLLAATGVAVRDWVSYFGLTFNINPDLDDYRRVRVGGMRELPMTSLERERRGPLRPSMVRERFVEHFQTHFGFGHVSLFTDHAALRSKGRRPRVAVGGLHS